MRTRRTRAESVDENRGRVLEAAYDQFIEKGFHGASLDTIAAAAGFSKGVVYSQFGGKDDLFLALLEQSIERRRRDSVALAEDAAGREGFVRVAGQAIGASEATKAWQALLLEFRVHAARNPATNARYAVLHERAVGYITEVLADVFARGGTPPPMPVERIARMMFAIFSGLSAELLVEPDLDAAGMASELAEIIATPHDRPTVRSGRSIR